MATKTKGLTAGAREKIVKASASRWRKARAEQQHLPGMEPVTIPEIEEAADAFFSAKEDRDDASTILDNCKADLIAKMKKHDIRLYDRNGVRVEADTTDKVRVKKYQAEKEKKAKAQIGLE